MKDIQFFDAPASDPKIWDHNKQFTDGKGGGYIASTAPVTVGIDIKLGAAINFDYTTKIINPIKNALVVTGGTTSAPRVAKNHLFKTGEFVFVSGDAVVINSIDTTNTAYDTLTLSAACVGAAAGAYLEQAVAVGATPVVKFKANALLGEKVKNVQGGERAMPVLGVFELIYSAKLPYAISPDRVAELRELGFIIA